MLAFLNLFYFLIFTYLIFSIISSKRYSTTGKVKPGMCIIGQLPIMVKKNTHNVSLYSNIKNKNEHYKKDNESITFYNFRKWS